MASTRHLKSASFQTETRPEIRNRYRSQRVDILPEVAHTLGCMSPQEEKEHLEFRKARFYKLTRTGRMQLVKETTKWRRLAIAIGRILGPEVEEG